MEIALDFAINCSPDHPYVTQHPDWFIIARTARSNMRKILQKNIRIFIRSIFIVVIGKTYGKR